MDDDGYYAHLETLDAERKQLRIYMTHSVRDNEYMSVLSYRTSQAIAACEEQLAALRKFQGKFTA